MTTTADSILVQEPNSTAAEEELATLEENGRIDANTDVDIVIEGSF